MVQIIKQLNGCMRKAQSDQNHNVEGRANFHAREKERERERNDS